MVREKLLNRIKVKKEKKEEEIEKEKILNKVEEE
jgi:hypothetical protein